MDVLDGAAQCRRSVGLVSHVADLRDRDPGPAQGAQTTDRVLRLIA